MRKRIQLLKENQKTQKKKVCTHSLSIPLSRKDGVSVGEGILVYLFACVCSHDAVCECTTAESYCCCVAVIALPGRRWKIFDRAASSNTEQLETDAHYGSSLSERGGKREERGGSYEEREGSSERDGACWEEIGEKRLQSASVCLHGVFSQIGGVPCVSFCCCTHLSFEG